MISEKSELPDLPELEAVGFRQHRYGSLLWMMLAMYVLPNLLLVGYGFFRYHQYLRPHENAMCIVVLGLPLIIWARALLGFSNYATDLNGLTLRGVVRRGFIPWHTVTSARIVGKRFRDTLHLRTMQGDLKLRLSALGNYTGAETIAASVNQHLRRLGKIELLEPSDTMLRLWTAVPERVPRCVDWSGRMPEMAKAGLFLLALWVPLALWGWYNYLTTGAGFGMVLYTTALLPLVWLFLREGFSTACAARVTDDYLEVDLFQRQATIFWGDVTDAQISVGTRPGTLRIDSRNPRRSVSIPLVSGENGNEGLILAAVRRLRQAGQAIPLPVTSGVRTSG